MPGMLTPAACLWSLGICSVSTGGTVAALPAAVAFACPGLNFTQCPAIGPVALASLHPAAGLLRFGESNLLNSSSTIMKATQDSAPQGGTAVHLSRPIRYKSRCRGIRDERPNNGNNVNAGDAMLLGVRLFDVLYHCGLVQCIAFATRLSKKRRGAPWTARLHRGACIALLTTKNIGSLTRTQR